MKALLGFGILAGVLGSAWAYTMTGSLLLTFLAYSGAGVSVLLAALVAALMFPQTEETLAEDPLLLLTDWQASAHPAAPSVHHRHVSDDPVVVAV